MEAFEKKGFFKGIYYTVRRLLRCNPFFEGGYDPLEKSRD
jgi:putative component of membrane protein insertase Oxa1/YidC/SpoIIIJ protein YidD